MIATKEKTFAECLDWVMFCVRHLALLRSDHIQPSTEANNAAHPFVTPRHRFYEHCLPRSSILTRLLKENLTPSISTMSNASNKATLRSPESIIPCLSSSQKSSSSRTSGRPSHRNVLEWTKNRYNRRRSIRSYGIRIVECSLKSSSSIHTSIYNLGKTTTTGATRSTRPTAGHALQ